MARTPKNFRMLLLAVVLLGGDASATLLRAEEGKSSRSLPYPSDSEIIFKWEYSCPSGKGCSFNCPGSGGANNVTKLNIYLGSFPLGGTGHSTGMFYEFSTVEIPRGNGFNIAAGLGSLACQVVGMKLDYSGPPLNGQQSQAARD